MAESCKDTLFDVLNVEEDFVFNTRVVEVFDDMLERSIPFYREVIHSSARLMRRFVRPGDRIYDLGSSNGTSLLEFAHQLDDLDLSFIGVDNSQPMLEKARLKAELFKKQDRVSFTPGNITEFADRECAAIILNYTLQFIRPIQREEFLRSLYKALRPGGLILLSEKVILKDHRLNRDYIAIYHDFKKSKGYSELEIAKKREALENVLIPFTTKENKEMLQRCGFAPVEVYFQWFNFVSLAALKPLAKP